MDYLVHYPPGEYVPFVDFIIVVFLPNLKNSREPGRPKSTVWMLK